MKRSALFIAAAAMILLALALIVAGLQAGRAWIWQAGLGAVAAAMILSFVSRWAGGRTPEE